MELIADHGSCWVCLYVTWIILVTCEGSLMQKLEESGHYLRRITRVCSTGLTQHRSAEHMRWYFDLLEHKRQAWCLSGSYCYQKWLDAEFGGERERFLLPKILQAVGLPQWSSILVPEKGKNWQDVHLSLSRRSKWQLLHDQARKCLNIHIRGKYSIISKEMH